MRQAQPLENGERGGAMGNGDGEYSDNSGEESASSSQQARNRPWSTSKRTQNCTF